jgi:hypothetical protein
MRILLATLLLIAVIPAYGSMIVVTGVTELSPPPSSLLPGVLTSDSTIYGFSEQQGVLLASNVNVGISTPGAFICCSPLSPGVVDAGTTVNSYLLYASPVSDVSGQDFREFTGTITFSPGEKIVGIILGYQNIAATDALLGAPGTTYPPGTYKTGGLEPNHDEVIVSSNMQSVTVNFYIEPGNDDMIRILTTTPEPADFVLLGSGLLALAIFGRRLRFGRAGR